MALADVSFSDSRNAGRDRMMPVHELYIYPLLPAPLFLPHTKVTIHISPFLAT